MKPKRYKIDSFEKLCNVVNKDNAEVLAVDLAQWLLSYNAVIQATREKYPQETEGKLNTQICEGHFIFYDDGKNDIKGADVFNPNTGEITHIPAKKKR